MSLRTDSGPGYRRVEVAQRQHRVGHAHARCDVLQPRQEPAPCEESLSRESVDLGRGQTDGQLELEGLKRDGERVYFSDNGNL